MYTPFQNTYPLSQVVECTPLFQNTYPITSGECTPLFQNTYPLSQVVECIPCFRTHTPYHKWWNVSLFQNTYPLSQVVECIPLLQNTYPITSGGMYTPYFSAHIVPLSEHIYYFEKCALNLDCVLYSKTPNFDTDHTP